MKKHKQKRHNDSQPAVQPASIQPQPCPAQQIIPANPSRKNLKPSRLVMWAHFLTPAATILTLVFAVYQAWLTYQKDEMAAVTLTTAQKANAMAMQSSQLVEQAEVDLGLIHEKQKELESLTLVSSLSIRAENGDRAALLELIAMAPDATASRMEFGPVSIAKKNLDRITHKFNSISLDDPAFQGQISSFASSLATPDTIASDLHHTNFIVRSQAAFNASFLRVNKLIPVIYETTKTEPDLHALSVMCYSLNQLLDPKNTPFFVSQVVSSPEWASNTFDRLWLPAKDALLAQSPKKWITVEPTKDSMWNTILIDPDTQDGSTGHPKMP